MILESKFNPGDTVYRLKMHRSQYLKPCEVCNATGRCTLVENGKKVSCPECRGTGKIAHDSLETCEIEEFLIGSLSMQLRKGDVVVTYYSGDDCQGLYSYEEGPGLRLHEAQWPVYGSKAEAKGAMEDKDLFSKEELLAMREFIDAIE